MTWTRCPMCKDNGNVGIIMAMGVNDHMPAIRNATDAYIAFICCPSKANLDKMIEKCHILSTAPQTPFEKAIADYHLKRDET